MRIQIFFLQLDCFAQAGRRTTRWLVLRNDEKKRKNTFASDLRWVGMYMCKQKQVDKLILGLHFFNKTFECSQIFGYFFQDESGFLYLFLFLNHHKALAHCFQVYTFIIQVGRIFFPWPRQSSLKIVVHFILVEIFF